MTGVQTCASSDLAKIDEAERMIGEEKWLSAAQELNSITSTQSP